MTTALVLGSADTLAEDLARAADTIRFDGVVACNDAGVIWPGDLDGWVSLHPRYWEAKGWVRDRLARGHPPARRFFCHPAARPPVPRDVTLTPFELPGQPECRSGSSGLFAAKVALVDLAFERVVLCGIPMTAAPHFTGSTHWIREQGRSPALGFRDTWLSVDPAYRNRMASMSGWTRTLLGGPERWN